ncbi:hypothetical protein J1N09_06415 [Aureitalea sp. L0-47]|uniref:hypothetical protein n=1 Tax=Aureitalea sp. L0-47 TaxID=2816962 RepID=UPI002237A64C|nr:hypothetical protein [Aureitalea sp. L0-47]MCW5519463.1 hypothetical protein [Aureitalea sp. L0-47]
MKKKFWTSDKVVSFVAIVVSVFSLFIFVKQTNIIEEQNHLSVMPYLLLESSNNAYENEFKIEIVNHGVGPAIIQERLLYYKGEEYDMEFVDFLKDVAPGTDSINVISSSTLQPGFALPAGASRQILKIGGSKKSYDDFMKFMNMTRTDDFQYVIKYKSIYGDNWKITSQNEVPEKLED